MFKGFNQARVKDKYVLHFGWNSRQGFLINLRKQVVQLIPTLVVFGQTDVEELVFFIPEFDAQNGFDALLFAGFHEFKSARYIVDVGQCQSFNAFSLSSLYERFR